MALTAIANLATGYSLEMNGCYIKARNPNKRNIQYTVSEKPYDLMTVVKPIVKHAIEECQDADRYILFCRTYKHSATLFELLILELENSGMLITTTVSGQTLRICEKFTACSSKHKEDHNFIHQSQWNHVYCCGHSCIWNGV